MSRESAYYDDQSKGGGGNFAKDMASRAGMGTAASVGVYAAGKAASDSSKAADQAKREADAEMKRESRGVQKPANFDAIEESKRDAQDARDRKKISDMGYAKGGMTASARADGCCTKGKTRGKMM